MFPLQFSSGVLLLLFTIVYLQDMYNYVSCFMNLFLSKDSACILNFLATLLFWPTFNQSTNNGCLRKKSLLQCHGNQLTLSCIMILQILIHSLTAVLNTGNEEVNRSRFLNLRRRVGRELMLIMNSKILCSVLWQACVKGYT